MIESFSTNFVSNIEKEKEKPLSDIGASLHSEECVFALTVDRCDHGILVVLSSRLLTNPIVEFASAKEIHPQSFSTELIVRLSKGHSRCDFFTTIIAALSTMSDAVFDRGGWRLEGWNGAPLVDLAEVGGRPGMAQLVLLGRDSKWANMLRRTLLGGIKVLAINDVTLRCNTSILEDEVFSERLRLIPVRCGEGDTLKSHHLQTCFTLNVITPEEGAKTITNVASGSMESTCEDVSVAFSAGGGDSGFIISRLSPGQCIDVVAQVHAGTPRMHARFACVSTVGFRGSEDDYILPMRMVGQLRPSVVVNEAFRVVAESIAELRAVIIRVSRTD